MKIVYNIYVAVRKLWNAIFGKNGDGSQLVIPGRISGASGDVTVGDGLNLTSDVLKSTVPVVSANPTLAGTEDNLTGLQVGDTKYKVPSGGGGTIYSHFIETGSAVNPNCCVVYTSSDTTFTTETFAKWLYDRHMRDHRRMVNCTTFFNKGSDTQVQSFGGFYSSDGATLTLNIQQFTVDTVSITEQNIGITVSHDYVLAV